MSTATSNFSHASPELEALFAKRFSSGSSVREQHGRDEGHLPAQPPEGVIFPETTEEVARALEICHRHRIPVIPFGVGTSLEGQVMASHGGLSIDLSRMNRVLEINAEDLDARVQAGVTRRQLNRELKDSGLFFPVDPGADATIGGMASTRASGTNAVRYGTIRDNVMGLTVVLADGRVIRTGGRARKSAAGYDLTSLFIGAEGTLGVITELTVRLYGKVDGISSAVCSFDTLGGAVDAVIEVIQLGIPVARIELLDEVQIDAINRYSGTDYRQAPTLFMEFHGTRSGVEEHARMVGEIAGEHGGRDFQWATNEDERQALWRARHDAAYACKALRPGCEMWPTDVCVPISRLAECITETRRDIDDTGLTAPIVGHVGDGNFHVVMVLDTDDAAEMRRAEDFNRRLIARALSMGGTCTGEHGIGLGKRAELVDEHGGSVEVMMAVKQALDPLNIMNPGKLFGGA
ncbi:MAG TPA: FAD-linked oxidase C-terminal domain-containing protein [Arenicellales bacterium]|nr:FAD-linked oxidase C-terminal domain-containing protein [Arenicellales bacterium]